MRDPLVLCGNNLGSRQYTLGYKQALKQLRSGKGGCR